MKKRAHTNENFFCMRLKNAIDEETPVLDLQKRLAFSMTFVGNAPYLYARICIMEKRRSLKAAPFSKNISCAQLPMQLRFYVR